MKCFNCGAELTEEAKFCPNCGAKIQDKDSGTQESDVPSEKDKNGMLDILANKCKAKISAFWKGLDLFCKISVAAVAAAVLFLFGAVCVRNYLSVFFSVLQLGGVVMAVFMHRGWVKLDQKKSWLQYLVLGAAVLLTVFNIMSYLWEPGNYTEKDKTDQSSASEISGTAAAPYSAEECVGQKDASVRDDFIAAGFASVEIEEIEDLPYTEADRVHIIETISVEGKTDFAKGQEFDRNDTVLIRCHTYEKCKVTIHVDFVQNLLFNTYDVNLLLNGVKKGTLSHGEDKDFELSVDPGEYTLTFESDESSSVEGEASLTIECDTEASYKISGGSEEVSVENLYVDKLKEPAEGEVKLDASASEYQTKDYREAESALKELGFTNVRYNALYDIVFGVTEEGEIESISIGGKTDFRRGDVFASDAEVIISYHMPEEDDPTIVTLPKKASSYIGKDYLEVQQEFKTLGFTNIEMEEVPTRDTSCDEGAVTEVAIDGSSDFEQNDEYKNDKTVHISYYVIAEPEIITMTASSDSFAGKDGETVKADLEKLGFLNIKVEESETTDTNNQEGMVASVLADQEKFESGTQLKDNAEILISLWKIPSKYETAFVRTLSGYSIYYMFDTDTKEVVTFSTSDTYVDKGTYSGDFAAGAVITWEHGEWQEKLVNKSGSSNAVITDGNGYDWEYKVCDTDTAQDALDKIEATKQKEAPKTEDKETVKEEASDTEASQEAAGESEADVILYEKGAKGEEVRTVQNNLIKLGYLTGAADGAFGDMTKAAIEKFQAEWGLEVNGAITRDTAATLQALVIVMEEDTSAADNETYSHISIEDAHIVFENYGEIFFPNGFKCHWILDKIAEERYDDGSVFLKVGVTIKDLYGNKTKTTAEGRVGGTSRSNAYVEDFYVY